MAGKGSVNIGLELVADPSILFWMNPRVVWTHVGEDCHVALKDLANLGMTVIAVIVSTLHSIFALFDHLLSLERVE